jgi:hypothetical protein
MKRRQTSEVCGALAVTESSRSLDLGVVGLAQFAHSCFKSVLTRPTFLALGFMDEVVGNVDNRLRPSIL